MQNRLEKIQKRLERSFIFEANQMHFATFNSDLSCSGPSDDNATMIPAGNSKTYITGYLQINSDMKFIITKKTLNNFLIY